MKANKVPRRTDDRYYTPDDVALRIVKHLQDIGAVSIRPGSAVLEPSVGGGAFVRAVKAVAPGARVTGIDLDPEAPGFSDCDMAFREDFSASRVDGRRRVLYDLAIGNPPFTLARAFVEGCLPIANTTAMLLRLGFLATEKRRDFWLAHPPASVHVLTNRPSFTGDGATDGSDYAVFVWDREPTEYGPVLYWL